MGCGRGLVRVAPPSAASVQTPGRPGQRPARDCIDRRTLAKNYFKTIQAGVIKMPIITNKIRRAQMKKNKIIESNSRPRVYSKNISTLLPKTYGKFGAQNVGTLNTPFSTKFFVRIFSFLHVNSAISYNSAKTRGNLALPPYPPHTSPPRFTGRRTHSHESSSSCI